MKTRSKTFIIGDETAIEDLGSGISRQIMAYDGQLMLVKVCFEKGAIGALHTHYHTQGCYVVSGEFEVTIGDEKKNLKAGDSFYVEPDIAHGVICLEQGILMDAFTPVRADFLSK